MTEILAPLVKYGLLALGAAGLISAVWVRARKAIKDQARLEVANEKLEALKALNVRRSGRRETRDERNTRLQRIVREAYDDA